MTYKEIIEIYKKFLKTKNIEYKNSNQLPDKDVLTLLNNIGIKITNYEKELHLMCSKTYFNDEYKDKIFSEKIVYNIEKYKSFTTIYKNSYVDIDLCLKKIENINYLNNFTKNLSESEKKEFAIKLYHGLIHFSFKNYGNFITVLEKYGEYAIKSLHIIIKKNSLTPQHESEIDLEKMFSEYNMDVRNIWSTNKLNNNYFSHIGLDLFDLFESINVIDRNFFKENEFTTYTDLKDVIQYSNDVLIKCSNMLHLFNKNKIPKFSNNSLTNLYNFNKLNKYQSQFTNYHKNILKNLYKIPFRINPHSFVLLLLILNKKFGDKIYNSFCNKYFINLDISFKDILLIDKEIANFGECPESDNDKIKKNILIKKRKVMIKELCNTSELKHALSFAYIYLKAPSFYLPVYYDFRGRVYCRSQYLNYQKNEIIRSLIMFNKSCIINDINEYKKHCVKLYFDFKQSNSKLNEYIQEKDLNNLNFFKANKPFELLLLLFELNSDSKISHIPIRIDATCSGIQHIAALVRDPVLGHYTNLSYNLIPQDIYNFISDRFNEILQNPFSNKFNHIDQSVLAFLLENKETLLNMNLDRNFFKKIVMTIPYNISQYGFNKHILNQFEFDPESNSYFYKNSFIKVKHHFINQLSTNLFKLMKSDILGFKIIIQFLNFIISWIKIFNFYKKTFSWETLNGLIVKVHTLKTEKKQKNIKIFGKRKSITVNNIINFLNTRKQINSIPANLIHSLDALHLQEFINKWLDMEHSVLTIHDCFAIPINNLNEANLLLKQEFINIYKKNVLYNINLQLETQISQIDNKWKEKHKIPEIPKIGSLDIENIIKSEYLFY